MLCYVMVCIQWAHLFFAFCTICKQKFLKTPSFFKFLPRSPARGLILFLDLTPGLCCCPSCLSDLHRRLSSYGNHGLWYQKELKPHTLIGWKSICLMIYFYKRVYCLNNQELLAWENPSLNNHHKRAAGNSTTRVFIGKVKWFHRNI